MTTSILSLPKCSQSEAPTGARLLAAWARRTCPHLKPDDRCRRAGGGCRLLGPALRRCDWAEHGAAHKADEAIYRAYLALAGGPWWRIGRAKLRGLSVATAGAGTPLSCPFPL